MRLFLLNFFIVFTSLVLAQDSTGNVLFWSAQKWDCEEVIIQIFDYDKNLISEGSLKEKYVGTKVPECGTEHVFNVDSLPIAAYYFVADCSKEACSVCNGEGSYWQGTAQNKTASQKKTTNKGSIEGTYKTCHYCQGNGAASQILWTDTFSVHLDKCRTVLLK